MKTITSCLSLYTLRELVMTIKESSYPYTRNQILELEDLVLKQEVKIRKMLQNKVIDLRDLSQQLFDWKEYDFSNVYTEFAEEYIQELEVNIWG